MADTPRTVADLTTLLADNALGNISPQDLRDLLASVTPAIGAAYWSTPAATTIGVAGTHVKAAGTTTSLLTARFSHASNRLTYTGAPTISALLLAAVTVSAAVGAKQLAASLAENGTVLTGIVNKQYVADTNEYNLTVIGTAELATNDYIELFVTNETDTQSVTVQDGVIAALGILK